MTFCNWAGSPAKYRKSSDQFCDDVDSRSEQGSLFFPKIELFFINVDMRTWEFFYVEAMCIFAKIDDS